MNIKQHFFGTNCLIDKSLKERADIEHKAIEAGFRFSNILLLNQVHGNDVIAITDKKEIYGDQGLPKADGIITNLPNLAIGVVTADCGPILLKDEEKNIIAAIHAGWRGAKAGIIANTIKKMRELGAKNIKALIGPMIQATSYEASLDFLEDFLREDAQNKLFFTAKNSEKFLFDLPAYIEKKLHLESVADIVNTRLDTYTNEKDFFSFRRATHQKSENSGRNISIIMIQAPILDENS